MVAHCTQDHISLEIWKNVLNYSISVCFDTNRKGRLESDYYLYVWIFNLQVYFRCLKRTKAGSLAVCLGPTGSDCIQNMYTKALVWFVCNALQCCAVQFNQRLIPISHTVDKWWGGYSLCSVLVVFFCSLSYYDYYASSVLFVWKLVSCLRMPSTSYERYLGYPHHGITNRSVLQYSWCFFFRCNYCTKFQMQSHLPILGIFAFFDSLLKDFFLPVKSL